MKYLLLIVITSVITVAHAKTPPRYPMDKGIPDRNWGIESLSQMDIYALIDEKIYTAQTMRLGKGAKKNWTGSPPFMQYLLSSTTSYPGESVTGTLPNI